MLLEHLGKHFQEADEPELAGAYQEDARATMERAAPVRMTAMADSHTAHGGPLGVTRAQEEPTGPAKE